MGKGISLSDLPEPYRRQAEQKLIQEMQRRAVLKPKAETAKPGKPRKKEKPVKPPKLRNQKVTRGDKTFASKREAHSIKPSSSTGNAERESKTSAFFSNGR